MIQYYFFDCYLAVPRSTLGHNRGDSLTNPMLTTALVQVPPEGHREPRNEVGSLYPAEHLEPLNREPSNSNCNVLTH